MRNPVVSLSRKLLSAFFTVSLTLGLIPITAFAEPIGDSPAGEAIEASASDPTDNAGQSADDASSAEGADAESAVVPSESVINREMPLDSAVVQAGATKSFFLAQTLGVTKSVPVVSAKLPLDATVGGSSTGSSGEAADLSSDESLENVDDAREDEGEGSDVPDLASVDVAPESTVVGSFASGGIAYAVEPGGGSVAVVAADYAKLPDEQVNENILVIPSAVSADGADAYSVTRIADGAFSGLTEELARVPAVVEEDEESEELEGAEGEESFAGILAIGIPASVSSIEDGAFSGADTLQYFVVSDDNDAYATYDGALCSADLTRLLLIPEGREGAVRIAPNVMNVDPEVFSHCPLVDSVIADADSAAFSTLGEIALYNGRGEALSVVATTEENDHNGSLADMDMAACWSSERAFATITDLLDDEEMMVGASDMMLTDAEVDVSARVEPSTKEPVVQGDSLSVVEEADVQAYGAGDPQSYFNVEGLLIGIWDTSNPRSEWAGTYSLGVAGAGSYATANEPIQPKEDDVLGYEGYSEMYSAYGELPDRERLSECYYLKDIPSFTLQLHDMTPWGYEYGPGQRYPYENLENLATGEGELVGFQLPSGSFVSVEDFRSGDYALTITPEDLHVGEFGDRTWDSRVCLDYHGWVIYKGPTSSRNVYTNYIYLNMTPVYERKTLDAEGMLIGLYDGSNGNVSGLWNSTYSLGVAGAGSTVTAAPSMSLKATAIPSRFGGLTEVDGAHYGDMPDLDALKSSYYLTDADSLTVSMRSLSRWNGYDETTDHYPYENASKLHPEGERLVGFETPSGAFLSVDEFRSGTYDWNISASDVFVPDDGRGFKLESRISPGYTGYVVYDVEGSSTNIFTNFLYIDVRPVYEQELDIEGSLVALFDSSTKGVNWDNALSLGVAAPGSSVALSPDVALRESNISKFASFDAAYEGDVSTVTQDKLKNCYYLNDAETLTLTLSGASDYSYGSTSWAYESANLRKEGERLVGFKTPSGAFLSVEDFRSKSYSLTIPASDLRVGNWHDHAHISRICPDQKGWVTYQGTSGYNVYTNFIYLEMEPVYETAFDAEGLLVALFDSSVPHASNAWSSTYSLGVAGAGSTLKASEPMERKPSDIKDKTGWYATYGPVPADSAVADCYYLDEGGTLTIDLRSMGDFSPQDLTYPYENGDRLTKAGYTLIGFRTPSGVFIPMEDHRGKDYQLVIPASDLYTTFAARSRISPDYKGFVTYSKRGGNDVYTNFLYIDVVPVYADDGEFASPVPNRFVVDDADGDYPKEQMVISEAGGTLNLPAIAPTKAGYVFQGWWTNRSGGSCVSGATRPVSPERPHTYYARFALMPKLVLVTWDAVGGAIDGKGTLTVIYELGDEIRAPAVTPIPGKYIMKGWFDQPNGQGAPFQEGMRIEDEATRVFYVDWAPQEIAIELRLDADAGEVWPAEIGDPGPLKTDYDRKVVTMPAVFPQKPGRIMFMGWSAYDEHHQRVGAIDQSTFERVEVLVPNGTYQVVNFTGGNMADVAYLRPCWSEVITVDVPVAISLRLVVDVATKELTVRGSDSADDAVGEDGRDADRAVGTFVSHTSGDLLITAIGEDNSDTASSERLANVQRTFAGVTMAANPGDEEAWKTSEKHRDVSLTFAAAIDADDPFGGTASRTYSLAFGDTDPVRDDVRGSLEGFIMRGAGSRLTVLYGMDVSRVTADDIVLGAWGLPIAKLYYCVALEGAYPQEGYRYGASV